MAEMIRLLLIALLGSSLTACSQARVVSTSEAALSTKLSMFSFIDFGDQADVIVGTRAARYREDAGYMPLEISVANREVRTLMLTLASFVLIDENGGRYYAANPQELRANYRFLDMDRAALADLADIAATTFDGFGVYQSKFTPTQRAARATATTLSIVRDTAWLPRNHYLVDYVYFPAPRTGIRGRRFDLVFRSPSLSDSVVVAFAVN